MKTTDKHGHELLGGKPVHKSDRTIKEIVKGRSGSEHEITHCVHCGARMSRPKK